MTKWGLQLWQNSDPELEDVFSSVAPELWKQTAAWNTSAGRPRAAAAAAAAPVNQLLQNAAHASCDAKKSSRFAEKRRKSNPRMLPDKLLSPHRSKAAVLEYIFRFHLWCLCFNGGLKVYPAQPPKSAVGFCGGYRCEHPNISPAPFALKFSKKVFGFREHGRKSLPGAGASQAEKGKHSDSKVVIRRKKKNNWKFNRK